MTHAQGVSNPRYERTVLRKGNTRRSRDLAETRAAAATRRSGFGYAAPVSELTISKGLRVRLKVELKVAGGDVIEKTAVEYIQGAGTMLPGLESELEGLKKGDTKEGTIEASRAFGSPEHQPKKIIPRAEFPEGAALEVGEKFAAKGPDGQDVMLEVLKSEKDSVEVRFLHPLADKDIDYDVEVLAVRDPVPPPLPAEAVAEDDEG